MPRIIGVDIPGNKRVEYSLRYLYGVGPTKALEIIEKVGIDRNIKASELTPDQIAKITKILQDDIMVEGDLRRAIDADIRRLQQITREFQHGSHLSKPRRWVGCRAVSLICDLDSEPLYHL